MKQLQDVKQMLSEEASRQQTECESIFVRRLESFCPEIPAEQRQQMAMTFALARITENDEILESAKSVIESATNLIMTVKNLKTTPEKVRYSVRFRKMIEESYEEFDQFCMDKIADKIIDPTTLVINPPYNKTTLH